MSLCNMIYKLRSDAKMSQSEFAELFDVSQQAVQKWETGVSLPSLEKVADIAKRFGISIDALVLERDTRVLEELKYNRKFQPKYANMHEWELYSENLLYEYRQSVDEGFDVSEYKLLFESVARMPRGEHKKRIADVLFDMIQNSDTVPTYPYNEPSELDAIRELRTSYAFEHIISDKETLKGKIEGAWMGRVCGCLLGKPFEGMRTERMIPFLKQSGNYPMRRYLLSTDFEREWDFERDWALRRDWCADVIDGMPVDDDTNYTVLAQLLVEKYGRDFTAHDVSRVWLDYQPKNAYCTAERVAFCNFVKGYEPPESAAYKNPFREWIGAQIRADYFGYINPGVPQLAAEMAFRDASVSHVKNGIYGEMFVAAMIACAAVTDNIEDIVLGGLAEIPSTSRLYQRINEVVDEYRNGVPQSECFERIHRLCDEHDGYDWCHTISNAMIVVAALLYGGGNFGKSVCMAVETGFDTDCNGATVGSIMGMRNGIRGIGDEWIVPIHNKVHTSIFGVGDVYVSECVQNTLKHIKNIV